MALSVAAGASWAKAANGDAEKTATAAMMADTDGRTGGFTATVDLDGVERMSRMDENGRARSPADLMANWRAAWGADARVLQAGIRADDIRQAAFPTDSPQHPASPNQWR